MSAAFLCLSVFKICFQHCNQNQIPFTISIQIRFSTYEKEGAKRSLVLTMAPNAN